VKGGKKGKGRKEKEGKKRTIGLGGCRIRWVR